MLACTAPETTVAETADFPLPATNRSRRRVQLQSTASDRTVVERFIADRYHDMYGARIDQFLPFLLSVHDQDTLLSVVGLRPGTHERFFLEQYLPEPIDVVIERDSRINVNRREIVEMGNLAAIRGGSQLLFMALPQLLREAGFRWVTFTLTVEVQLLLRRLGYAPQVVTAALPGALPDHGRNWGAYYCHSPRVAYGNVELAWSALQRNEMAQRLLHETGDSVTLMAQQLNISQTGERS